MHPELSLSLTSLLNFDPSTIVHWDAHKKKVLYELRVQKKERNELV